MKHDLERFVAAQGTVYSQVVRELKEGKKLGHWMWYIFPQISGLGRSETTRFYALSSCYEASAYLAHPTLGARLRECTGLVLGTSGRSLEDIFGAIDALKFASCMTLFCYATKDNELFRTAIDKCCGGRLDQTTIDLIQASNTE
ncbi:MAG: DUF1810 domain-containing protein [Gemmatimonadales bacterium]